MCPFKWLLGKSWAVFFGENVFSLQLELVLTTNLSVFFNLIANRFYLSFNIDEIFSPSMLYTGAILS
jgi:hypothetical protein